MDPSRSSSVYSSSSRKSTYLNYRPSVGASGGHSKASSFQAARNYAESLSAQSMGAPASARPAPPRDYAESIGSQSVGAPAPARPAPVPAAPDTAPSAAPLTDAPSAAAPSYAPSLAPAMSPSSRSSSRHSSRPSFMNYQSSAPETRTPPVAVPQAVALPAPRATGVLVLVLAAEVHAQTMKYVQTALKKRPYASIAIIGSKEHEPAVKQLKMEMYGLIGKLGREMGVQTHVRAGPGDEELGAAVQQALGGQHSLQGVLCSLAYDGGETTAGDILSLEPELLQRSWLGSVGFLHGVAKATIPLLTSARGAPEQASFFLAIETAARSPVALLNKAACDALLRQLSTAYTSHDLTIDLAENVLISEPEPTTPTYGVPKLRTNAFSSEPEEYVFSPGESPTKLWNMWALQNENGG
ncbi:hypothetical protein LTR08_002559 [Meristemomyces frigidus]|nr:hypothetical protein LTR08_002559 [Meristemomyces frigidus]